MVALKPQFRAAAHFRPDAVRSRLMNFLLQHHVSAPIAEKVTYALDANCDAGHAEYFAAELINMALGEGTLVGTQGRDIGGEPDAAEVAKVNELAYHVATVGPHKAMS